MTIPVFQRSCIFGWLTRIFVIHQEPEGGLRPDRAYQPPRLWGQLMADGLTTKFCLGDTMPAKVSLALVFFLLAGVLHAGAPEEEERTGKRLLDSGAQTPYVKPPGSKLEAVPIRRPPRTPLSHLPSNKKRPQSKERHKGAASPSQK